jgi:hypothetical protein
MSNVAMGPGSAGPSLVNTVVWTIVSVVGGGVIAIIGTFGIVSVVGALPPAVDAPYVVYGNS